MNDQVKPKKKLDLITEQVQEIKKKWAPIVEGIDPETKERLVPEIKDRYRKNVTARLLENTQTIFEAETLREGGNLTTNVDNTDPVLINLVRRVVPNMLAYDMVGVQPMTGPTGLIFCLRSFYGDAASAPFGRPGDARPGFQTGSTVDTAGHTPAQVRGINGVATSESHFNEYDTTKAGTGSQTSNATAPTYSAYSVGTGIEVTDAETMGRGLSGDLEFQTMSFTIEKTNVWALTRALKAEYTNELAQDLRVVHGLDAESELSNILSTEILGEINREIINRLRQVAKVAVGEAQYVSGERVNDSAGAAVLGTAGLFDINLNSDGRWSAEKYKQLLVKINKECNAIAKDTRRGRGNFMIVSSNVAVILDLAGKMTYAPGVDNNLHADDTGATFIGTLQGRIKVYIDPFLGYDEVIVGYKGPNQMDAGFFYCPYVPLQKTSVTDPNTGQPRMFYKTRYGVVANPFTAPMDVKSGNSYYRKFKVTGI